MPIFDCHCCDCDADFELLVMSSTHPKLPAMWQPTPGKAAFTDGRTWPQCWVMARGRAQAAKEGHLSHFSPAERKTR